MTEPLTFNVNVKFDLADIFASVAEHEFLCDECNGCDDDDCGSELRSRQEIIEELEDLEAIIWYRSTYQRILKDIVDGDLVIVDKCTPITHTATKEILRDTWNGICEAAQEVEDTLGLNEPGNPQNPLKHHDLRILKGRLEALRWVLGDDFPENE